MFLLTMTDAIIAQAATTTTTKTEDTTIGAWQAVIVAGLSTISAIVVAFLMSRSNKRNAASTTKSMNRSIGIPNGHGSLMDQNTQIQTRIGQLAEHVYSIHTTLTDHIAAETSNYNTITDRVSDIAKALRDHTDWCEENERVTPRTTPRRRSGSEIKNSPRDKSGE